MPQWGHWKREVLILAFHVFETVCLLFTAYVRLVGPWVSQDSPVFVSLLTIGALGFSFNNPWLLGQHYSFMQGVSIQIPFFKIIYFKLVYKVVDHHKAFSYILSFDWPSLWALSYSLVPCLPTFLLRPFCLLYFSHLLWYHVCSMSLTPDFFSPSHGVLLASWPLQTLQIKHTNPKFKAGIFYMRRMYAYAFLSLGYLTQNIFILPFLLQTSYFHISLQLSKQHCIPQCITFSWSSHWLSGRHLGWVHFLDCD